MGLETVYDAVVIGAGPAGASAAQALAAGGARVLLLEKARLPRYKPCGGGITSRAQEASIHAAAFVPETEATTLQMRAGTRLVACAMPRSIRMTMRDRFDHFLVERAVAAGAELREGTALRRFETASAGIRLQAGGNTIQARYLIGSDGANGVTARLAGFADAREPATAIEAEVAVAERVRALYSTTALLDFAVVRGGYAWIFGKRDHLSVGVYTTDAAARRDLRPALAAFLAGHADLRDGRVLLQRGYRVPLAGGRRTRLHGAVLLAGDAAALADPLTGEGISYALASGMQAGRAVLAALAGDARALADYDSYVTRVLCRDLRFARVVAAIAYRFPAFGLRLTDEHPGLRALTAAAVCGTLDYRSLTGQLVRTAPRLLRYASHI